MARPSGRNATLKFPRCERVEEIAKENSDEGEKSYSIRVHSWVLAVFVSEGSAVSKWEILDVRKALRESVIRGPESGAKRENWWRIAGERRRECIF